MNKNEILKKIGVILSEIQEQHSYLSENPLNSNDLELELFLANSKFLTGHIEIFQKLGSSELPVQKPVPEKETFETLEPLSGAKDAEKETSAESDDEAVEVINTEATTEAEQPDSKEKESNHEEFFRPEPVPEQVTFEAGPEIAPLITKEVVISEKTVSIAIPAQQEKEAIAAPTPTINEQLAARLNAGSTPTPLVKSQTTDLKSLISLNDKLLFVKDLFNGYSLAYSEALDLLNRFDNFEAADNFLKSNYAGKNNWAGKQSTVDYFYEILNRRFAK